MNFKQLELELKTLVEKHKKLLPKFEGINRELEIISRIKYTRENEYFNEELREIKQRFVDNENIKNISEKEAFIYMVKFYIRNYEYGLNSESDIEFYKSRFN